MAPKRPLRQQQNVARTRQAERTPGKITADLQTPTPEVARSLRYRSPLKKSAVQFEVDNSVPLNGKIERNPRSSGRHRISVQDLLCSPSFSPALSPTPATKPMAQPRPAETTSTQRHEEKQLDDAAGSLEPTNQPEAGPSKIVSHGPLLPGAKISVKGKQRAVTPRVLEKRVMPGRIRRAAGGGADGIRDLEEMVVDWLDRWGAVSPTPPDDLPIYLSTLPLSMIHPSPYETEMDSSHKISLTPGRTSQISGLPPPSPRITTTPTNKNKRIETPDWIFVKPGDDDAEEARGELGNVLPVLSRSSKLVSPVKRRIRHGRDEDIEDTSDEYYHLLHRKYEVFERRQRIREKEKLQFERYKMRSRIDLLKGMSKSGWSSIVTAVLSRFPSLNKTHSQRISGEADIGTKKLEDDGESQVDIWRKGREKIQVEGIDWLREKLVKEGEDLLKRYDQLLPIETRRPTKNEIRNSTPLSSTVSPSLSPPPTSPPQTTRLPARVTALRETLSTSRKRVISNAESFPFKKPRREDAKSHTPRQGKLPPTPKTDRSTRSKYADQNLILAVSPSYSPNQKVGPKSDPSASSSALRKPRKSRTDHVTQKKADLIKAGERRGSLRGRPATNGVSEESTTSANIVSDHSSPLDSVPGVHLSATKQAEVGSPGDQLRADGQLSEAKDQDQSNHSTSIPLYALNPILATASSQPYSNRKSAQQTPQLSPENRSHPANVSYVPYLLSAASRREELSAKEDKINRSHGPRTRRMSGLADLLPFGIAHSPALEVKADFNLIDHEEFWGMIAQRQALRGSEMTNASRRSVMMVASNDSGGQDHEPFEVGLYVHDGRELPLEPLTPDEALELEGVEDEVVI